MQENKQPVACIMIN